MAKAMCVICLLACVVQVWSSEAVVDGEEKSSRDVPCRWTGSGEGADVRLGPRDQEAG
jgi:hypothetical protein